MSDPKQMANLRDRLKLIENKETTNQQVNEFGGVMNAIRSGATAAKDFGTGLWAGIKNLKSPQVVGKTTTGPRGAQTTAITNVPANTGARVGATIASRPAVAVGGAAVGAGTAAALSGDKPASPAAPVAQASPVPDRPASPIPTNSPPSAPSDQEQSGQSTKPAASGLSKEEEGEMGVLAQELGDLIGQNPELDKLILQYQKLRPGAADAQP